MAIIMKKFLKKFYITNKNLYREFKYKNNKNTRSGISTVERERLLSFEPFTTGIASFFDHDFTFSHGPSFIHSVDEILVDQIYKFKTSSPKPYIIDCGANIGLSLYYFKKLYPNSEILAFEPDEEIFEILKKNVGVFPNSDDIVLEKKAAWIENTQLTFFSEGALAGSLVVDFGKTNNSIKIEAIDLKEYLKREVDFLKIDIEGAENVLIFDLRGKLGNVKNVFLEYHGIIGETQNLGEILNLLKEEGFEYYIRLANETIEYPFFDPNTHGFNQQLNILCYRKINE